MKQKKLHSLLLSGLIIGPVLGSGIIILPPVVYQTAGNWALPAWIIMIGVSFVFAYIFGFLSILYPGDSGVTLAVRHALGKNMSILTSFYLIGAVFFGPVAVLMTASEYISPALLLDPVFTAFFLLCLCLFFLTRNVSNIGRIALVLSSASVIVLLIGGISTLLFFRKEIPAMEPFDLPSFGYSLLLLFWTIVGWEVIGNYSGDIEAPEKTIPKAISISAIVVAVVCLTVAAAIQFVDPAMIPAGGLTISSLLYPVFGAAGKTVMSAIVFSLCITTYLLFVGGVARLICALAHDNILPKIFKKRLKNNAPVTAILVLGFSHVITLFLVSNNVFQIESLIALADGFFISNALIGIIAAIKLFKQKPLKILAILLAIFLFSVLLFSSKIVLSVLLIMAIMAFMNQVNGGSLGRKSICRSR